MAKLIHAMIRVQDVVRSKQFYCDILGFEETHRMDFPQFALVYLREPESGFEVELTLNKDQVAPYTHGTGYGHLACCVNDLEKLREQFELHGFTPGAIKTLATTDSGARFFFVSDPDGYKMELLEKSGHYQ